MKIKYVIINQEGERFAETADFKNKEEATNFLISKNYTILEINEVKSLFPNIKFEKKITPKEIENFTKQLTFLIEAKISFIKSMKIIQESQSPKLRVILEDIIENIEGGERIYLAFSKYNQYFINIYINMIKIGEETGSLGEIFSKLGLFLENRNKIISKAKSALIYPAFISVVLILVIILMMTIVVPNITQIIKDSGQELPLATKIVISMSDFFINHGLKLLIAIGVIYFFVSNSLKDKNNNWSSTFDEFKISNKITSSFIINYNLSIYFKSIHLMTSASLSITNAIRESTKSIENAYLKKIFIEIEEEIKKGNSVSESFSSHSIMPNIAKSFIVAGEKSGNLANTFGVLAKYFEDRFNEVVENILKLIEPILIIVLAITVGGILIAVLVPIYDITSNVG